MVTGYLATGYLATGYLASCYMKRSKQTKAERDLNVSSRNLESHSKTVVVETVVKCYQSAVNSGLNQTISKLLESNRLDPLDDSLIRPDQHVCTVTNSLVSLFLSTTVILATNTGWNSN